MKKINIKILLCFILISASLCYAQIQMTVDEAVKTAMDNNPRLKSARLNIEKEEAAKLKSFNIPRPQLFLEYEGIKGSLNNFDIRKAGISQEFEFPTSYFLRADVQGSQVQVSKQELFKLSNDLKAEVKSAYYRLQLNTKLLDIAKEKLKLYDEFLFIAGRKYEAGSGTSLEVLGAKVNKIKTENELKNIESDAIAIQSELKKLMNVSYGIMPSGDLTYVETALVKQEILTTALANNPDLKITKYQKEKFSNKLSLSKAELLPNLSFSYYRQKTGNDADYWGVEFGVGIPLWFWWEQAGNIKESGFELQIAESDEINVKKNIENEVNQLYTNYENSLRQLQFFRDEAIGETDEIFRQAKTSYEEGEIGYVEYLQALSVVYDTKTEYMNAVYNYNISLLNLEKITAGALK